MSILLKFKKTRVDRIRNTTLKNIDKLRREKNKKKINICFSRFSKIVDSFFSKRFHLPIAFTYHDIEERLKPAGKLQSHSKDIQEFLTEMSEIKYGKKEITRPIFDNLIKDFENIVDLLSRKDQVYLREEPLFDYLIGKYLDFYDSIVERLSSTFKPNTKTNTKRTNTNRK